MKNITLSIPDNLLSKSREYAESHGKSLNKMVRELLTQVVNQSKPNYHELLDSNEDMEIDTSVTFDRDALYDR